MTVDGEGFSEEIRVEEEEEPEVADTLDIVLLYVVV
jgi:hypothetical protein